MKLKICYYTATSMDLSSLLKGIDEFKKSSYTELELIARTKEQLSTEQEIKKFISHILSSHCVILSLHGGAPSCPGFEAIVKSIISHREDNSYPLLFIHATEGDPEGWSLIKKYVSLGGRIEDIMEVNKYLLFGGSYNFKNLLLFLEKLILNSSREVFPPCKLPDEGIYHHSYPHPLSLEQYFKDLYIPSRPTIGIWFYQSYWVNSDLSYLDALIKEIENRDANALCVFHLRYKDKERGNHGADYIVEKFFMKDNRSIIDVLISPMMFSLTMGNKDYMDLYKKLNVPVIQAMLTFLTQEQWKQNIQGLSSMEISYSVAQPEFDGNLITTPVATRETKEIDPHTGALIYKYEPIEERIKRVVSLALKWTTLRKKNNREKKVAIIFHHYPPRNDRIGCAAGLDSFESVKELLHRMYKEGYQIEKLYNSGEEISSDLLEGLTYDSRWCLGEQLPNKKHAIAIEKEQLEKWSSNIPGETFIKMREDWGEMPGDLFTHHQQLFIPGMLNGNIFLTIQPPRGYFENIEKLYHDPYLSPPYNYLAHYRWIRDVFKADAVIHVGKHGSLEWLPGKSVGLSEMCWPDIMISDIPNIYPYIINDPSEGTQAKRRSYCCIIDHLTPIFTNAELYDELAKLDDLLKEYSLAKTQDKGKLPILRSLIWDTAKEAHIIEELNLSEEVFPENFEDFLSRLHTYLSELWDTMINQGLHVLGRVPPSKELAEYLTQLTRISSEGIPSLREAIIEAWGFNYQNLIKNKGKPISPESPTLGRELLEKAHRIALSLCQELISSPEKNDEEICLKIAGTVTSNLKNALSYIRILKEKLEHTTQEIDFLLKALNGGFVPPGPSGAPTRGQAHILPTGRNFYSVDPRKIPTPGAWEMGKKLGDALLKRYLEDTGNYPSSIGIIVWGGPTMRTGGDDIAQILYLLGVKPRWSRGSMEVEGIEIIPKEELGRPRIDVVPRISGFFRDCFPNLVDLIHNAVSLVASLEEEEEENFLRKNVIKDMESYIREGHSREKAFSLATLRIFGCPPGTYGAGVAQLVESGKWKDLKDLADIYITYSSYAYGGDIYGEPHRDIFEKNLSRIDLTVKNEDSREYDMMSCTDFYNYYGGLIASVRTMSGKTPHSYVGDSSDPENIKIRTTSEEAKHVLRSRIVNPKWLSGMKKHGYKGAGDISKMMDVILGWDATANVMEDWMYEEVAKRIALNPEIQKWMKQTNPYALHNIVNKLLEAIQRGMWKAQEKTQRELQRTFLEIEGDIEEITEE